MSDILIAIVLLDLSLFVILMLFTVLTANNAHA
jgi:hypothetical protein